jgi:RNA polymerase sigma factor (sigma-70 family)
MSPLTLRRYRAERLLRQEFEALRGRVIAAVRARLGASGASLDPSDLDACYAQAWQGLYAAVLDGQEIANPAGWLTLVTFRRAIEELRTRARSHRGGGRHEHVMSGPTMRKARAVDGAEEPDFAAELDDRMMLRQLFEGLRGRLSAREREAAALCYLQGLSRPEAAARMGISVSRMRKLMDGQGAGRPGVAGKVGELAETIRDGSWCEAQGSLMRGLAYGILDPDGERYRLALIHRNECPACRAYVASLRGLASALPPVLLPWGLGAGALIRAGAAAHGGVGFGAGAGAGAQVGAGVGAGAQGGVGIGGALSASGAAGVGGAAGGSWLLAAGSLGGKLAVGCLLALGVGAGCVALTDGLDRPRAAVHRHDSARAGRPGAAGVYGAPGALQAEDRLAEGVRGPRANVSALGHPPSTSGLTPAGRAAREFGPERGSAAVEARSSGSPAPARLSSSGSHPLAAAAGSSAGGSSSSGTPAKPSEQSAGRPAPGRTGAGASAAEREFGIG